MAFPSPAGLGYARPHSRSQTTMQVEISSKHGMVAAYTPTEIRAQIPRGSRHPMPGSTIQDLRPINSATLKPQWPMYRRDGDIHVILQAEYDVYGIADPANGY